MPHIPQPTPAVLTFAQNVAIAISTNVYNHIDGVGEIGGIVGKTLFSLHFRSQLANELLLSAVVEVPL